MKVALIGNMNNNHFSFMRYLRDLEIDAYLLMYSNEQEHFLPQNDTWQLEKWKPFIKKINLDSGGKKNLYLTKKQIQKELRGFNIYIGNGHAPGYFYRAGMILDIFLPYAEGVEGLCMRFNPKKKKSYFFLFLKFLQRRGLIRSTILSCSLSELTIKKFKKLDVKYKRLGIPMVYQEEAVMGKKQEYFKNTLSKFSHRDFILFSHVSHIWKNPPYWWKCDLKSNHILIEGFSLFIKQKKCPKPLLVLIDYGIDVNESKQLISSFGISNFVLWLPKMSRKEIMYILDFVDIGCGELGGAVWGSTGWEFMSKGIPFFQSVDLTPEEYEIETGNPFPPIVNVSSPEEIRDHLLHYEINRDYYISLGTKLKEWYDSYAGISLAMKYQRIIENIYKKKAPEQAHYENRL